MNNSLIYHPATLVWILLMLATGLSWYLGLEDMSADHRVTATGLLAIAFIKVRFVIHYFMEVHHAPLALRLVCDTWVVGICMGLIGLYWFGA